MISRFLRALILVPLGIVLVVFAVANRENVTVSLDPFDSTNAALSVTLPLFAMILILVLIGVLVGGIAAWFRQQKWRTLARYHEREAKLLRDEMADLRRRIAALPPQMQPGEGRSRLSIPPPAA
jgi:uncharacterized integral membrane protein